MPFGDYMKRFMSALLIVVMLIVVFSPCYSYAATKDSITTPATSISFIKGCKNKLIIKLNNKLATSKDVDYSSSDEKIATIDVDGMLVAKAKGKAIITAKSKKDKKTSIKININVLDTKSFAITPNTVPINGAYLDNEKYNSSSKHCYVIRSFLEYFETHPNCTLRLKKGTYSICNILYVPSNTKIILSDGVVVKKSAKTGSKVEPSGTLFALCAPSKAYTSSAYKSYNGVHDVKIVGEGNATIDMKNAPGKISVSIVMCHNKNITIKDIKFTNLKYGHFIEMDASYNAKVFNCKFTHQVHDLANSPSECINLDTPDKKTDGFHQVWTSYDCTPNKRVYIAGCSFYKVQRAIGTHQYTDKKYHKNITINNCSFKKCKYGAVYMMNWIDAVMIDNEFNGIGKNFTGKVTNKKYIESDRAFLLAGCSKIVIKNNKFSNCFQVGAITNHKTKTYPVTYNTIKKSELNIIMYENSVGENVDRPFVRMYVNACGNGNSAKDYYIGAK